MSWRGFGRFGHWFTVSFDGAPGVVSFHSDGRDATRFGVRADGTAYYDVSPEPVDQAQIHATTGGDVYLIDGRP